MDRREFVKTAGLLGGVATGLGALGTSPLAQAADSGVASRRAMQALLETINQVQMEYLGPAWNIERPEDIAEGQRFILHVLETGLHFWLEADPERPVFQRYVTPGRKLLGDNPDALYYFAPIRGDRRYRIRGNLASATFTSFTIEGGSAEGRAASRSISAIDDTELQADAEGNFEILVSPERPERGNWLKSDASAGQITTRHYYESRNCVAADPNLHIPLSVEPLDAPALAPADGDEGIARRIHAVANFVRGMTLEQPKPHELPPLPWVSTRPNHFNAPGQWLSEATGYGNVHAHYAMAPFVLMPDEALVIEGRFPTCRFANLNLWTRFMQTFDYRRRPVSLNRSQTLLEPDGSFRMIVAHRDPGLPNWLDTEGRVSGLMYWRYLLVSGDVPTPQARVVKFASLGR